jgi:hypothetical protein
VTAWRRGSAPGARIDDRSDGRRYGGGIARDTGALAGLGPFDGLAGLGPFGGLAGLGLFRFFGHFDLFRFFGGLGLA